MSIIAVRSTVGIGPTGGLEAFYFLIRSRRLRTQVNEVSRGSQLPPVRRRIRDFRSSGGKVVGLGMGTCSGTDSRYAQPKLCLVAEVIS